MTVLIETIRKVMGWCPMKDIEFKPTQNNCSPDLKSENGNLSQMDNQSIKEKDIPLQMIDWRQLTILLTLSLSFLILVFNDQFTITPVGHLILVLVLIMLMAFFFLFDHNRVSIGSEILMIKTPLFKPINIPKQKIKEVKTIDNTVYRKKPLYIVLIIVMLLAFFVHTRYLYNLSTKSLLLEDIRSNTTMVVFPYFLYIYMVYKNHRRSHCPKAIKIHAENKAITLFPRNDIEYQTLKEILEK
ncbi:hypothetical protein LI82_06755 [Methanococcoides methylutens]|uniref:DUF1673 domain-containing protein n=1 Tax=Methanococcoides methylutens TaxID=2226 RepID=A0A099T2Y4_METMT|nr:DUF1673 family protein [Methanococcoides methylutens]KGK98566.1 hypothetical protein LI82_06755 [Methanococcoides methylutens]